MAVTGAKSYVNYGYETVAFATAAASINKCFGIGTKLTNLEKKNNIQKFRSLGSRNVQKMVDGKFEGSFSIEVALANPWLLRAVLGGTPSKVGAGPYTWTFAEADVPPSITIENGVDLTTDAVMKYLGCICTDATLTMDNEGSMRATLNFVYAKETKATSGIGSQVAETEEPFPFDYASWDLGASAIATTRNVEINIDNSAEIIHNFGSRLATGPLFKGREYKVTIENQFEDASVYHEKMYGAATGHASGIQQSTLISEAKLTLDNGLATTNQRKYVFDFTDVKIDAISMPQAQEDMVMEHITAFPTSLEVTVINNTSTEP